MQTNAISEPAPATQAALPAPRPRFGKRGIIIAAGAALLLGGVGAGFAFLGGEGEEEKVVAAGDASSEAYVEVPPMIVNLRSSDGHVRFLKLRFIVVAADAARTDEIKERLPVILDALQPFLRELRPEDLNGSAAVFRVKEEMMARAASAIGAGAVRDILIQDLVQQ
ncbi:hypothetical protein ACFB49_45280 [Sphingomonas sp. DBB INV C78]|uniref:flagellar basal body-associated FliL family protein n=1 Tax=Sphingomonas sp. DBB INV C78 TaxID=3349434 RepID=UPI0036D42D41